MEAKINLAEILKDKPKGIILYSPIFGECRLITIYEHTSKGDVDHIGVKVNYTEVNFDETGKFTSYGLNPHDDGEILLFPSKEMRDWSKFAWKPGDVLVNKDGNVHIIFDGFEDDTYENFHGKNYLWEEGGSIVNFEEDEDYMQTSDFNKANKEDAQEYIHKIEKELGGKLNRETLEIEKTQPEFKDGDILLYKSAKFTYFSSIFILDTNRNEMCSYVRFSIGKGSINYDVPVYNLGTDRFRYATEEEKQQLFDALAKEGKAWDSEHKMIVDLKPKVELKPFDKVLVRDDKEDQWSANIFSYQVRDMFYCLGEGYWRYCIPYEGNEHLLGTTKEVED